MKTITLETIEAAKTADRLLKKALREYTRTEKAISRTLIDPGLFFEYLDLCEDMETVTIPEARVRMEETAMYYAFELVTGYDPFLGERRW